MIVRLLMVSTVPATINAFLLPFAQHFRRQGWQVDALAHGISSDQACVAAFDHVWEVDWSRNPLNAWNLFTVPRVVRELVTREAYDLVHVHTPVAAYVTRRALRTVRRHIGVQVVYTAHGFHFNQQAPAYRNCLIRGLEKQAGRWTDYLVVINREDEEAARSFGTLPADRVRYMPGIGVDTEFYSPARVSEREAARVRTELGLGADEPLFLMVAEFNPGKRHRDALSAFARLNHPTAHLAFAGVGKELDAMKKLATQLAVQDRVHFLGYRKDIPSLIRASVATLLPSEREGLPRCIMESLCMGVPAIGTDIRGVKELLADGCGHLVKVGDVEGLTKAMGWLLEHPEEAQATGRRGRERMAAYDLRHILELHERLYEEAVGVTAADGVRV